MARKIIRRTISLFLVAGILFSYGFYVYTLFQKPSIPAFPGAAGFGSTTIGGRGGQVIKVTNLNDSGLGSLRYALEEVIGPRFIVFEVSGIIDLTHEIQILYPYVTVAGQTSPGEGIIIRNAGINVATHDVIIRGLKIRVGDNPVGEDPMGRDAISIAPVWDSKERNVYNVIIDHNEFAWAVDENVSIWNNGDPNFQDSVRNVTYSWNFIYEGLKSDLHPEGAESMGLLLGDNNSFVSLHHNLIANNDDRSPRISNIHHIEMVNNLIYNWGDTPSRLDNRVTANIVNNYYRPGPNSSNREIKFDDNLQAVHSLIYIDGNYVDIDTDTGLNEGETRFPLDDINAVILQANISHIDDWYGDFPPLFMSPELVFPLTFVPDAVEDVYDFVLHYAGSQKPDSVNQRIVADVENLTGAIIASQEEVGGWPPVADYTVPLDSDDDGMPDEWELRYGTDPQRADSMEDTDKNGYANIEDYVNSLIRLPDTE